MASRWTQNFNKHETEDPILQASQNAATDAALRTARLCFKEFDCDGSGYLDQMELEVLIQVVQPNA